MSLLNLLALLFLLLGCCRRMVFETRSIIIGCSTGQGRGRGRGGHDSPPLAHREKPIHEENREENHGEDHAN